MKKDWWRGPAVGKTLHKEIRFLLRGVLYTSTVKPPVSLSRPLSSSFSKPSPSSSLPTTPTASLLSVSLLRVRCFSKTAAWRGHQQWLSIRTLPKETLLMGLYSLFLFSLFFFLIFLSFLSGRRKSWTDFFEGIEYCLKDLSSASEWWVRLLLLLD